MRAELHLLDSGKSVKTRHTRQQIWNACKKAGLSVALVVWLLTIASRFMRGGVYEYDASPRTRKCRNLSAQGFVEWREGTPQRIRYAAEQFQKALQKEPNFVPALYGQGNMLSGRTDKGAGNHREPETDSRHTPLRPGKMWRTSSGRKVGFVRGWLT